MEKNLIMLEELFEMEKGELKETDILEELGNWDSMAKLSLIVLMGDEFNRKLSGAEIKELKTVQDILKLMS